jgi:hypothetical protein
MKDPLRCEHYILDAAGRPIPCRNHLEWARWFETADRIVRREHVDHWRISTVFLGLDHNFSGDGPPLLFETMVFDLRAKGLSKGESHWMARYATRDEALAGHAHMTAYLAACGRPPGEEHHE